MQGTAVPSVQAQWSTRSVRWTRWPVRWTQRWVLAWDCSEWLTSPAFPLPSLFYPKGDSGKELILKKDVGSGASLLLLLKAKGHGIDLPEQWTNRGCPIWMYELISDQYGPVTIDSATFHNQQFPRNTQFPAKRNTKTSILLSRQERRAAFPLGGWGGFSRTG